jgi:putative transposase
MKRKRFSEEKIIGVLREHEAGAKTADLARKHGVSEATIYDWKAKYGGMDVSDAKRLKA